jgi:uncharacterized protein (UPF0335 family)
MIKRASSIAMTYSVSDAEKRQAEVALLYFKHADKALITASDYLDLMKTPFKDHPEISPEEIEKTRAAIRRFRDKAVENFNQFKVVSFKCVQKMQAFTSDGQVTRLLKSFISAVEELEDQVNNFVNLFTDLKAKDFPAKVVSFIENIQKQCSSVEEVINERVMNHIQTNILAKSWVNQVSDHLQISIEKQKPLILDLFNQRQNQLNDLIKDRSGEGNP